MGSANRETGIGIGIMLAAVEVEDITIILRDIVVRVAVTDTGEGRPMNMIVQEGGGSKMLASIIFFSPDRTVFVLVIIELPIVSYSVLVNRITAHPVSNCIYRLSLMDFSCQDVDFGNIRSSGQQLID